MAGEEKLRKALEEYADLRGAGCDLDLINRVESFSEGCGKEDFRFAVAELQRRKNKWLVIPRLDNLQKDVTVFDYAAIPLENLEAIVEAKPSINDTRLNLEAGEKTFEFTIHSLPSKITIGGIAQLRAPDGRAYEVIAFLPHDFTGLLNAGYDLGLRTRATAITYLVSVVD